MRNSAANGFHGLLVPVGARVSWDAVRSLRLPLSCGYPRVAVAPELRLPLNPVYIAIPRRYRGKSQQNKASEGSFGITCEQRHTQVVRGKVKYSQMPGDIAIHKTTKEMSRTSHRFEICPRGVVQI